MLWKLVPVDPTDEIRDAGYGARCYDHGGDDMDVDGRTYIAMLAAAPPASQDEELVERVSQTMCRRTNPNCLAYGGECVNTATCGVHADARAVIKMLEGNQ